MGSSPKLLKFGSDAGVDCRAQQLGSSISYAFKDPLNPSLWLPMLMAACFWLLLVCQIGGNSFLYSGSMSVHVALECSPESMFGGVGLQTPMRVLG